MGTDFNMMEFFNQLVAIPDRQLENETKAAKLIEETLDSFHISYTTQKFLTKVPKIESAELVADGKNIPCYSTSFVSGVIEGKDNIISCFMCSQKMIEQPNINFNPYAERVSRSNHYFAPSIGVEKRYLPEILQAKKVRGEVQVMPTQHESANILVGNLSNPETILFCHYDSLGPGAIDNASGTALLLDLIINAPSLQEKALFVIAGNEELSYDKPLYWGFGYRAFQSEYVGMLDQAKKIFVVDSLGNGKTEITSDIDIVRLGFPVNNLEAMVGKTYMVYGDLDNLFEVYHGIDDTPDRLDNKYMEQARNRIVERIASS